MRLQFALFARIHALFRFYKLFTNVAKAADATPMLHERIQFGWLDGNSIANSVIMGEMSVPGALAGFRAAYTRKRSHFRRFCVQRFKLRVFLAHRSTAEYDRELAVA